MPTLIFHPRAEEIAATGVNRIVREKGVYTLEMVDGTTKSARLETPNDADTLATVAMIMAAKPYVAAKDLKVGDVIKTPDGAGQVRVVGPSREPDWIRAEITLLKPDVPGAAVIGRFPAKDRLELVGQATLELF